MARGHNSSSNPETNNARRKNERDRSVRSVHDIQRAIDYHWESMPGQVRTFLLETLDFLTLQNLSRFWASPSVVEYTRGDIARCAMGASWLIALNYLRLGKAAEARALTLNGAFLEECYHTPIETIIQLSGSSWKDFHENLRFFAHGLDSLRTPETMEQYLHRGIPLEHQSMMTSFVNIKGHRNVMNLVGQIGDDWSSSCPRSSQKPSSQTPGGTRIRLILVNSKNEEERHSFDFASSTTLKALFNAYAEERGVSLRSLRFSHGDKILFLSTVGNKTPDELNLRDQDVITVLDASSSEEIGCSLKRKRKSAIKKNKKSNNYIKKPNPKGKNKRNKLEESMTLEEHKERHSEILSKLHEEVQSRLKQIRTRLNALDLERQPPKHKRKNKGEKRKVRVSPVVSTFPDPGVGGKAGKPYFAVQVGEVQNLYKTTKRPMPSSQNSSRSGSTLDLHGFTREEALGKLDESLKVWVDTAMRGSYPFVIGASIICGCGNQVLSETVQEWIKTTTQVCNAPKSYR